MITSLVLRFFCSSITISASQSTTLRLQNYSEELKVRKILNHDKIMYTNSNTSQYRVTSTLQSDPNEIASSSIGSAEVCQGWFLYNQVIARTVYSICQCFRVGVWYRLSRWTHTGRLGCWWRRHCHHTTVTVTCEELLVKRSIQDG